MSDVFSLAYGCCLAIHLMGLRNENANIVLRCVSGVERENFVASWEIFLSEFSGPDTPLPEHCRYVTFTVAWICKARDQWDADLWEAVLILSVVALAVVLFLTQDHLWKNVDKLKFSTG